MLINARLLAVGGVLAALAALFQLIPAFLSEAFLFISILSSMPVLVAAKFKPQVGLMVYTVAGMLILSISTHEAIFFVLVNGIIGLVLGSGWYFTISGLFTIPITAAAVTVTISCINFFAGIPVLWVNSGYDFITQFSLFFVILLFYCSLYWFGAKVLVSRLDYIHEIFKV